MYVTKVNLRKEVHELAQSAFQQHLISGYGDGEYPDKYQIIYKGKTRHLPLRQAYNFLSGLIKRASWNFSLTHS